MPSSTQTFQFGIVDRLIGSRMKVLVLAACIALAAAAPGAKKPYRDMSKFKDPRFVFPHLMLDPKGPPRKPGRIVGGTEARPHAYPHQVGIFMDGSYFCGGQIIDAEWVMTAAHCCDGFSSWEIIAGAHDISQNEETQVRITSSDVTLHENWNTFTLANDICLVSLPEALTFNENIQPIALGDDGTPTPGTILTATGWGRESDSSGGITDILREVDVPAMDWRDCNAIFDIVTEDILCIDSSGGMGTCNGDSGGPLVKDGKTYGVTSFGSSAGCEAGYPDGFTNVNNYVQWIYDNSGLGK